MTDAPTPDSLRSGSLVGPWRVEPEADVPLAESAPAPAMSTRLPVPVPVRGKSEVDVWAWWRGLYALALVLMTVGGIWWMGHGPHSRTPVVTPVEATGEEVPWTDEPASLADASVTVRVSPHDSPGAPGAISLEVPEEPLPGQLHPPCRRRGEVEINGGCWGLANSDPPCENRTYEWKGACYWPVLARTRRPTSDKPR